jgi:hypothetical protein
MQLLLRSGIGGMAGLDDVEPLRCAIELLSRIAQSWR